MKLALFALLILPSLAFADGVQVCVDSKGSSYTAHVSGFAVEGSGWSARIDGHGYSAIPAGTDLSKITFRGNLADVVGPNIEDLSFQLKHLVTPSLEALQEGADITYNDEPRVYQSHGVDLVCSSTMSADEYASLAK
jgi:hypothetical protein